MSLLIFNYLHTYSTYYPNGTLKGYYYGIVGNGNRPNTEITINGGTIKGNDVGIYHPQNGTLTINGGTIEGYSGVYVKAGAVTAIKGGTIKATGTHKAFEHSDSGFESTGDALVIENCDYPGGAPSAIIQGATLTVTDNNAYQIGAYAYVDGANSKDIANIYSTDNTLTVPAEYEWTAEDTYGYKLTASTSTIVAQIGSKTYETLAAAIAAVPTDGTATTITMVNNTTIDVNTEISGNKKITLELNGKTISGTASGNTSDYYLLKTVSGADLTIQDTPGNGKITFQVTKYDAGYWKQYCTIYNCGAKLTIKSGTIENTTAGGAAYAVTTSSNAWGTPISSEFNLEGGTLTSNSDGDLRVYQNNSTQYSKNTVNISGGTLVH